MRYFNSASDLCLVDRPNAPYSLFFASVRNVTTASSRFEHDIPLLTIPSLCAIAIALAPCTLHLAALYAFFTLCSTSHCTLSIHDLGELFPVSGDIRSSFFRLRRAAMLGCTISDGTIKAEKVLDPSELFASGTSTGTCRNGG